MLSDRDYMRQPMEPDRQPFRLTGNQMLMIALVVIYILQAILNPVIDFPLYDRLGLVPSRVVEDFWIWQPFTYQFFQAEGMPFEFAFVLIGMFFFGPIVESRWGMRRYLLLFVSAGVFAGLLYTPLGFLFWNSEQPILGAVPSIMAIMVMASLARPNMTVLLFFVLPTKMKYMIWLFIGIDLIALGRNPVGKLAFIVPHLAGAGFGCFYAYYHHSVDAFFAFLEPEPDDTGPSDSHRIDEPFQRQQESPYSEEVDDILDKIHQEGINSLTPEERELLEKASDELKGEDRYGSF